MKNPLCHWSWEERNSCTLGRPGPWAGAVPQCCQLPWRAQREGAKQCPSILPWAVPCAAHLRGCTLSTVQTLEIKTRGFLPPLSLGQTSSVSAPRGAGSRYQGRALRTAAAELGAAELGVCQCRRCWGRGGHGWMTLDNPLGWICHVQVGNPQGSAPGSGPCTLWLLWDLPAKVIRPFSPSLIKNLITEALEASNHLLSWRNCFSISLPAHLEDNKTLLDLPRGDG